MILLFIYFVRVMINIFETDTQSIQHVENKAEVVLVPDYVGCFDQVKSVLNSTTTTHSFCEASCVKDLRHYLNKGGRDLARVQPIKTVDFSMKEFR